MQKQSHEAMIDGIRGEKIEAQKEAIFTLENQMPSENSGIQFLKVSLKSQRLQTSF